MRAKALIADYVLVYRNTKLAVVQAKAWDQALTEGVAQAKNYAGKLAVRYTYSASGQGIYGIDVITGCSPLRDRELGQLSVEGMTILFDNGVPKPAKIPSRTSNILRASDRLARTEEWRIDREGRTGWIHCSDQHGQKHAVSTEPRRPNHRHRDPRESAMAGCARASRPHRRSDAVADLGRPEETGHFFTGFQNTSTNRRSDITSQVRSPFAQFSFLHRAQPLTSHLPPRFVATPDRPLK